MRNALVIPLLALGLWLLFAGLSERNVLAGRPLPASAQIGSDWLGHGVAHYYAFIAGGVACLAAGGAIVGRR